LLKVIPILVFCLVCPILAMADRTVVFDLSYSEGSATYSASTKSPMTDLQSQTQNSIGTLGVSVFNIDGPHWLLGGGIDYSWVSFAGTHETISSKLWSYSVKYKYFFGDSVKKGFYVMPQAGFASGDGTDTISQEKYTLKGVGISVGTEVGYSYPIKDTVSVHVGLSGMATWLSDFEYPYTIYSVPMLKIGISY